MARSSSKLKKIIHMMLESKNESSDVNVYVRRLIFAEVDNRMWQIYALNMKL